MDDLISRAALLKECAECQKTDPRFEERGWANHFINDAGEPSTEWYCVEDIIENAPAVDAAPVVHGHWKSDNANTGNNYSFWYIRCSACGYTTAMTQTGWHYCPHCGAKMDGRESDG